MGRKRWQRSVSHSEGTKSYCTKNRRFSCRNPFGWMINFIEVLETLAICILIHLQGGFTCNEDETHTRPLLRAETFVLPAWFPFSSGLCQQGPPCHMRTSVPCLPTGSPPSSQRPAGLAFLGWPYQSKLCLLAHCSWSLGELASAVGSEYCLDSRSQLPQLHGRTLQSVGAQRKAAPGGGERSTDSPTPRCSRAQRQPSTWPPSLQGPSTASSWLS